MAGSTMKQTVEVQDSFFIQINDVSVICLHLLQTINIRITHRFNTIETFFLTHTFASFMISSSKLIDRLSIYN